MFMCQEDGNYIKSGEAAKFIGVSVQTLRNWQYRGILIPEQIFSSGHRRYSKEQLEKFVKEQEIL